jgi:hypothetical protein
MVIAGRRINARHIATDCPVGDVDRRTTHLALQPGLGLLPKRRAWSGSADCDHLGALGSFLKRDPSELTLMEDAMKKLLLGIVSVGFLFTPVLRRAFAQEGGQGAKQDMKDAKQDMKDAGGSTKQAAKSTGRAVKKTSKKATNKSAHKVEEGAAKVEKKTEQ